MAFLENHLSWWESQYLLHDIDYTILGAGIVGISTAIELKKMSPNAKVLVIDKKTLPIGASTRNAGFACFGSISEIDDDILQYGLATTQKLIQMRLRGLSILKSRIKADAMDYHDNEGAEIGMDNEFIEKYISKIEHTNSIVEDVSGLKNAFRKEKGPFGIQINNQFEGSLNPQKMMAALELEARKLGVVFLQGIDVEDINTKDQYLSTTKGNIRYQTLIVCTNGFSQKLLSSLSLAQNELTPARNQVIITERIPGFTLGPCYHLDKGYIYFREIDNRLLLGGGRNTDADNETTESLDQTTHIQEYLSNLIHNKILPNQKIKIAHRWSGILGVGESKMPIAEEVAPDVYAAIRMGGMGVAIGSYMGRLMASMILGDDNSDVRLFVS